MLTGVHILLSYTCLFQCDHCFLHCGPGCGETFTFDKLDKLLTQANETKSIKHICFEGGEPFLFFPLLLEGVRQANALGHSVEIVTCGYWALDRKDALRWLEPLVDAGLTSLNVSDDKYHHGDAAPSPAVAVLETANSLGIDSTRFSIDPPAVRDSYGHDEKGHPIIGGDVRFRGRAVDKLTQGLPRRPWRDFTKCPDEDLRNPSRVHVDSQGNVQVCQGVTIGNVWEKPLGQIMADYDPDAHPICGPLIRGGPALLAKEHDFQPDESYVDACHLCYLTRKSLTQLLPAYLAPAQAYGTQDPA